MSARLLSELEAERARCERLTGGFKSAGERELARLASKAAFALQDAARALVDLDAAIGEVQEREREA